MICWMNGKYLNTHEINISPFDHGYLYGLAFFDTFRTYKGKVFLFKEHYNRLISTLSHYRIKMPYKLNEIIDAIAELTKRYNDQDGIVHLNVSAGISGTDLEFHTGYDCPTFLILRKSFDPRKRGVEKSGVWLNTKINSSSLGEGLTSYNYGNKFLGSLEINNHKQQEGFFLTSKGFVVEGIKSNIFWVKDGIIYTPALYLGITPGITRKWVLHAAQSMGYKVIENVFDRRDVEEAYECFITNSIDEIVPISNIGKVKFLGEDGPVYKQLHQLYIAEVLKMLERGI